MSIEQSEQSAIVITGCLFSKPNIFLCFPEPTFKRLLSSPGIDTQPGGLVRQPYLRYWPARLHRPAESIPGLIKRLQIRAQVPASHFRPPSPTILVQGQTDRGLSDCCISFWPKYLWMPACPLLRDTL
jgi:hypothetical protein